MEQPDELIIILQKLDRLSGLLGDQVQRLTETSARLDGAVARLDSLDASMSLLVDRWRRLGLRTTALEDDINELVSLVPRPTPTPGSGG